jgi:hypothetical protein
LSMIAKLVIYTCRSCSSKKRPTKRAVDVWDSARFQAVFVA